MVGRPTEEVVELRIVELRLAVDLRTNDGMEPKRPLDVVFPWGASVAGSEDFPSLAFSSSLVACGWSSISVALPSSSTEPTDEMVDKMAGLESRPGTLTRLENWPVRMKFLMFDWLMVNELETAKPTARLGTRWKYSAEYEHSRQDCWHSHWRDAHGKVALAILVAIAGNLESRRDERDWVSPARGICQS
jgi:hypothetical protein